MGILIMPPPEVPPPPDNLWPNEPEGATVSAETDWSEGNEWSYDSYWTAERTSTTPYSPAPWSFLVEEPDGDFPRFHRTLYWEGFPGGYEAGRIWSPTGLNITTNGIYIGYYVRFSLSWQQANVETPPGNGLKHMIPFITGGGPSSFWGWTGFLQHSGELYWGCTTDQPPVRRAIPHLDNDLLNAPTARGEWHLIELIIIKPTTVRVYVNGELKMETTTEDIPFTSMTQLQMAGTYGGGIGNSPVEKWYDTGPMRISRFTVE